MMPMGPTEQRSMFDARIKIMWEEQLIDPPIDYYRDYMLLIP